jgi:hypothetical protein
MSKLNIARTAEEVYLKKEAVFIGVPLAPHSILSLLLHNDTKAMTFPDDRVYCQDCKFSVGTFKFGTACINPKLTNKYLRKGDPSNTQIPWFNEYGAQVHNADQLVRIPGSKEIHAFVNLPDYIHTSSMNHDGKCEFFVSKEPAKLGPGGPGIWERFFVKFFF